MKINTYISNQYKLFLILFVSLCFIPVSSAFAQFGFSGAERQADIYTIYNIEIDETSRNVTTARDRALRKGQRQALERLFRRIILTVDREKLPDFSDQEVTEFISGFEINDERRSSVRYIASLVVHFNRDKINEVLAFYKIPFAETLGTAVSVLPVLEDAGALMLWEKNNLWREAWQNHDVINDLVPIETPEPSLQNRLYISAIQAKVGNERSIQSFIEKNRLNELIIATATVEKNSMADELLLNIDLQRNDRNSDQQSAKEQLQVSVPTYDDFGAYNYEALFKAGVEAATDWVDDLWKSKVLVSYDNAAVIAATGELRNIDDWMVMQRQLEKVKLVRNVNLKSLTIDNVDLEIEYAGEPEQLSLSLAQQGLFLQQDDESEDWTIGLTGLVN